MVRSVSTRAFATSVNISEKAQNNLDECTYPIGSTISMQIVIQFSYGDDGAT